MATHESSDVIRVLQQCTTPTVANALELVGVPREDLKAMSPEVRCFFPEFPPMVGYAATATVMTEEPTRRLGHPIPYEHWQAVLKVAAPRVIVVQDLDEPPAQAAWWGELNGNIHRALGAVGLVTNGGVRDLEEVRSLGFQFFAAAVTVTHAYSHLMDYCIPVKVGGIWVRPGDLIHGDRHGVLVVPAESLPELPAAIDRLIRSERRIIDVCQSPDFSLDKLREVYAGHIEAESTPGRNA